MTFLEERWTLVTGRRGRRRKQLLDGLRGTRGYGKLEEKALYRTLWRNRFGRDYGPVVRLRNERTAYLCSNTHGVNMQGNFRDFFKGKNASYEAVNTVFVSTGYRQSMTYALLTFRKVLDGTEYIYIYIYGQMHVCWRQSSSNPKFNTLQRDRPQHDRPAACVIAQQYSSATIIVLRVHSSKKKKNSARVPKLLLLRYFNHA